jgi:anti-sigma regulatory factor (Ser/Thr protein kinase)
MPEHAQKTHLDRGRDAPSLARRAIEDWLRHALDRNQLEDVKLLVSELVTNAVRHPDSGTGIDVEVAVTAGNVRVVVTDPGHGFSKPDVKAPPDDSPGGRGLLIVERVASRWGVSPGRHTRVWFELDR